VRLPAAAWGLGGDKCRERCLQSKNGDGSGIDSDVFVINRKLLAVQKHFVDSKTFGDDEYCPTGLKSCPLASAELELGSSGDGCGGCHSSGDGEVGSGHGSRVGVNGCRDLGLLLPAAEGGGGDGCGDGVVDNSHGSRVGVPGLPACAYPTPCAAMVNPMVWRLLRTCHNPGGRVELGGA
jgi:hypothetical protein